MGNSILCLSIRFSSLRFSSAQCFSGYRISTLLPATQLDSIVRTLRLKVFHLSYALRGYDWETQFSALRLLADPRSSLRIIAIFRSSLPCPSLRLSSARLSSSQLNSLLSLLNSTTKNCTFNFCLSDPMRLDSYLIVTLRFFSPHFNRSHSTIKSVLSLKS